MSSGRVTSPAAERVVDLRAGRASLASSLVELWEHRELVYFLAWRDVRIRYKQAVLGFAWALVRPLLLMAVFTFIFSRIGNVETGGVPYPVFAFVGLLLWTYFSTAVLSASDSLVASANLVSKTYFPRLALPVAALLAQLPDLLVGAVLLALLMLVTTTAVSWTIVFFPVVLVLLFFVTFAIGVWFAALNVNYRDVKYVVPFLTQIWLFVTPVLYPSNQVPHAFQVLYGVNPMAGLMELARWSVLGSDLPSLPLLATSLCVFLLLFLTGVRYFRRAENTFADVI